MKKILYLILVLILLINLPLGAQDYSQNPFPNEMLSGCNSEKMQFNLPNPSFSFKGSGQVNNPALLRADGWLDNPYGDDDNNLKITPVSDGLIVLLFLAVGYAVARRRKLGVMRYHSF